MEVTDTVFVSTLRVSYLFCKTEMFYVFIPSAANMVLLLDLFTSLLHFSFWLHCHS